MTDIRKHPQIIDAINAVLNAEGIAEVKWEKSGLTVVQIKRTLVTPRKEKQYEFSSLCCGADEPGRALL